MTRASQNFRGIASMVLAAGSFVANDTCMKLALESVPPFQVLAMRGIMATLWCLPLVFVLGFGRQIHAATNRWVVLRALCELAAILLFITGLARMPIGDLTAIMQITPLIVVVGAALIWNEAVGLVRGVLISLGIVGALLVAQPGSAVASPYAVLGFAAAIGAAGRDLLSRRVGAAIPGLIVALSTIMIVMLAGFGMSLLFETWVTPSAAVVGLMIAAGFLLMCGQLFVFLAFRFAPPRIVAPFNYTFTVWAVLSGYFVFNNVPNTVALAGMALIILSGLAVIFMERRTQAGEASSQKPDGQVISS